jgi:hypothetical protein
MNQKEWKKSGRFPGKYKWYNQTRKIQRSLQYNKDSSAIIIHHLRDTEEQRNYNDTYYEYWGFNQDGTFEYGKYVVFWTKETHDQYHAQSEETKQKNSEGVKASITPERREKMSEAKRGENNPMYGRRGEFAPCYGRCGELHPMYGKESAFKGKHHTEESKRLMNIAARNRPKATDSFRKECSERAKARFKDAGYRARFCETQKATWTDERRIATSNERKLRIGQASEYYKVYKHYGGTTKWQQFMKYFYMYKKSESNISHENFIEWSKNNMPWA